MSPDLSASVAVFQAAFSRACQCSACQTCVLKAMPMARATVTLSAASSRSLIISAALVGGAFGESL